MAGCNRRALQGVSRLPHPPLLPVLLAAALLIAGYLAFTSGRYVIHNYRASSDEQQLRDEIRDLDRDHEQLIAIRDYLKSDEYLEDVARRVLGLVRPGETLVVVSGSDPAAGTETSPATPGARWWQNLFTRPESLAAPTPTP